MSKEVLIDLTRQGMPMQHEIFAKNVFIHYSSVRKCLCSNITAPDGNWIATNMETFNDPKFSKGWYVFKGVQQRLEL